MSRRSYMWGSLGLVFGLPLVAMASDKEILLRSLQQVGGKNEALRCTVHEKQYFTPEGNKFLKRDYPTDVFIREYVWAMKGSKYYTDEIITHPLKYGKSQSMRTVQVFDGQTQFVQSRKTGNPDAHEAQSYISKRVTLPMAFSPVFLGYKVDKEWLNEIVARAETTVTKPIGLKGCYEIKCILSGSRPTVIAVDPDKGFMATETRVRSADGKIDNRYIVEQASPHDGIWLPDKGKWISQSTTEKTPATIMVCELTMANWSRNVPDSLFVRPGLPVGSTFLDADSGARSFMGSDGQLKPLGTSDNRSPLVAWLFFGSFTALLGLVLGRFLLRRA